MTSVITRDGIWLGAQWVRINRKAEGHAGALSREQQINSLKQAEQGLVSEIQQQQSLLENKRSELEQAEQSLQKSQVELTAQQDEFSRVQSQHSEFKTRHEQISLRVQKIQEDLDGMELNSTDDQSELETLRHGLQRTQTDKEKLENEGPRLIEIREHHRQALDSARSRWQSTHEQSHEIALQEPGIN